MKPVKAALIGFGHLGRFHAQKIAALEEAEFAAIVEATAGGRERAKQEYPNVPIFSSLTELPTDIEAAIVVTPTSFHYEICRQLIEKGIHVFCEKPMTDRLSDAVELKKLVNEKGVIFQVGHSERCHEAWEKIADFSAYLAAGAVLRLDRYAPFKGRATDVDVVNDLMIHDLDLLYFVTGKMPRRVHAQGFKQRTNHWDHVVATLDWDDGTKAIVTVGRGHVHEIRSFEAVSASGVMRVDLFNAEISLATAQGQSVEKIAYSKRDHLMLEQKAFYGAIRGLRPIMVDIEAGLIAVRMVDAVLRSLEENAMVEMA